MKDKSKIQGLRDEVARLKEAAERGEQRTLIIRKQLAGTERELAALTATVFVGVVDGPSPGHSLSKKVLGLLPGMQVKEGVADISLWPDGTIVVSTGDTDTVNMYPRVGEEIRFALLYPEGEADILRIRVFASLEEAGAWVEKQ